MNTKANGKTESVAWLRKTLVPTCGMQLICSFRSYSEDSLDISTSPKGSNESLP